MNSILAYCDYKKLSAYDKAPCKAVFFDRDGTIHVDKVMTHKIKDLELFPDTCSTIRYLNERGYKVIIITNQSAIARGIYDVTAMHKFNMHLVRELEKQSCRIDAIYYCPHELNSGCLCSKPNTGMIMQAKSDFNINLETSYLIGDKMTDIAAGRNANLKSILVTTGIYDKNDFHTEPGYSNQITSISCLDEIKQYIF